MLLVFVNDINCLHRSSLCCIVVSSIDHANKNKISKNVFVFKKLKSLFDVVVDVDMTIESETCFKFKKNYSIFIGDAMS